MTELEIIRKIEGVLGNCIAGIQDRLEPAIKAGDTEALLLLEKLTVAWGISAVALKDMDNPI